MSRIAVNYWNGRGLMEVPRLMLAISGRFAPADYDDNRFSEPPAGLESNLGRLPTASIGGNTVGQSVAINYFIASEIGFLGSNSFEAAQILSIQEHIKEMRTKYGELVPWGTEPSAEKLNDWFDGGATDVAGTADRAGHSTRYAQWWMGRIEATLGNNGFAVGDRLSLADVLLYNTFGEHLRADEAKDDFPQHRREAFGSKARTDALVARHPKIAASVAAVANNANAQKWFATRGVQGF